MGLVNDFIAYINTNNLFQKKDYLLLAVSGGSDSVALCELFFRAGFPFEIAHCNFQLRGEESSRDEHFVKKLGEKYGVTVFVRKFDTVQYAEKKKVSIQVAARELRYDWFDELLNNRRSGAPGAGQMESPSGGVADYVVTAHHANDNIETLLMNFFKGTGIKGLQGILPRQGRIIRPILFAKKEAILSFIRECQLDFVEDSSNLSDKYTRNFFRHQLIPSIETVYPQVEENLLNNIERFKEAEMLYEQSLDIHKQRLLEIKGNEVHIPVLKLRKSIPLKTIVYEIIKDFGFTARQTGEVAGLLQSESGKYVSSSTHKIIKNRNWLIISPVIDLKAAHILINESDREIDFEGGKLLLTIRKFSGGEIPKIKDDYLVATIDADNLIFPLLLRKWKKGDYFYPLGMTKGASGRPGKKKISRFLSDLKLSVSDKEKLWVIESNKRIFWVVGKRIDDRFKIIPQTCNTLTLQLV